MTVAALEAWRTMSVVWRRVAVVVVAIVLLNLFAVLLNTLLGGRAASGPRSSSYSTASDGTAAYAELLDRSGYEVSRLRRTLADAVLEQDATLVVLDPGDLPEDDQEALRGFLTRGGRLVAGGDDADDWLDAVLESPPEWSPQGITSAAPLAPVAEVHGLARVKANGDGAWTSTGSALPVLGDQARSLAATAIVGSGRAILLADTSPLHNDLLDVVDNASFGLLSAGESGRDVVFAEHHHGYREATGLGALPPRWRWLLALLAIAGGAWLWAEARRLGPAQQTASALPPPRRAYVDALARTLTGTRRPDEAVAALRARTRKLLAARAGLPPEAGNDDLRRSARSAGLSESEIAAIFGPVRSHDDLLFLGKGHAHLARGES